MTTGPTPVMLDDAETLEQTLALCIANGVDPTVVGIDAAGTRFMALGIPTEDGDYSARCLTATQHNQDLTRLVYPVVVI
jgi:hypothetical protein